MSLISVVLPTLNRETYLLQAIDDLLKQTYKNYNIVVVDQSDQPSEKVIKLAQVNPGKIFYYHVNFRGLPVARNFGWQKATGDVVLYLDDDMRCNEHLVAEHAKTMQDASIGVVAGGIDEANKIEEKNPKKIGTFSYWTATPKRGFQSEKELEVQHAPGGNFSVRKKIFFEVGGFDENFSKGAALYEETDFCLRVVQKGHRIYFNPKARMLHLAASTGGCRVPQLGPYLKSMSRNRLLIIRRYLNWYHMPVALVRLVLLVLSYVRSQKDPGALKLAWQGFLEGLAGPLQPLCTSYPKETA